MMYWIIYDIASNRLRKRVSDKCKNYGMFRVQKSAFIGEITKNKAEMLMEEIKNVLGKIDKECVFLLPHCKECFNGRDIVGTLDAEQIKDKEFVYLTC